MKEALAERLLATVMNWTPEDVANERPLLQAMAALKYDEYQQFAPGIRFVESLALWLRQFKTDDERRIAYDFVKSRLVFFSAAEIAHLVTIAYPDYIRPLLIGRAARTIGVSERYVARIANSKEYKILRRQCLFLGLSDGARIDTFRRATNADLSHEQIWQTYEMSPEKGDAILSELRKDLASLVGPDNGADTSLFRMVFLLDDFSGSGRTYLRKDDSGKAIVGKIAKFRDQLHSSDGLGKLVNKDDLYVGIVLYIATIHAVEHLKPLLADLYQSFPKISCDVHVVQLLEQAVSLDPARDAGFLGLAASYYDSTAEDEHTNKGGTDVKCGFAGCALPLVLSHNTPNNSMFLLWANCDDVQIRGLFPRVSRHRSET
jgi:hypothetical protein